LTSRASLGNNPAIIAPGDSIRAAEVKAMQDSIQGPLILDD
jgi:hypothetical protein